jgi:hypothetical protein
MKSLFQGSVQQLVFLCVAETKDDPEFTEQIENITVPAGRNVKLACSVKNLGTYKVRHSLNVSVTHLLAVRVQQILTISNPNNIFWAEGIRQNLKDYVI